MYSLDGVFSDCLTSTKDCLEKFDASPEERTGIKVLSEHVSGTPGLCLCILLESSAQLHTTVVFSQTCTWNLIREAHT